MIPVHNMVPQAVKEVALVPFRGTVYIVRMPFVLLWMVLASVGAFLYAILAKIVCVPVYYVQRTARRIILTWNWTKSSAKSVLSLKSSSSSGTQTLDYSPDVESEFEYDLFSSRHGERRASRTHHGRKKRRKAVVSSLIKILLDLESPQDSEEETELSAGDEETDRIYKLIRDLIQFSKSGANISRSPYQGLSLETLRKQARDKEKLQNLIWELDQYVKDVDSGIERLGLRSSERSDDNLSQREVEHEDSDTLSTPDSPVSQDTDHYTEASEGESTQQHSEDEFNDTHSGSPLVICRQLSPVVEISPELGSADSVEGVNDCQALESELNSALTVLDTLRSELIAVEESVVEQRQTKITETVTIAQIPEDCVDSQNDSSFEDARDEFSSIPKTSPTLGIQPGHQRRKLANARKTRPPSQAKRSQQPPADQADQVEGCKVAVEQAEQFLCEDSSSDEDNEGVEGHVTDLSKMLPGSVSVLPHSLSDQFKLLKPAFNSSSSSSSQLETQTEEPSSAVSDLYSTVIKKPLKSQPEGDETLGVGYSALSRPRSNSDNSGLPAEKSLFIHDRIPPWKQIRQNSSGKSSSVSPVSTPAHAPAPAQSQISRHPTSPALPPRSCTPPIQSQHSMQLLMHSESETALHLLHEKNQTSALLESPSIYDKLPKVLPAPPIPSKAGEEGMYDIIPCHRRRYLHEKLAASEESSSPSVNWTPILPPRNSTNRLKRTTSAEGMSEVLKDSKDRHKFERHSSERQPSTAKESRGHSGSSTKRSRSTSGERESEKKARRSHSSSEHHHHHSRSSDHSPGNKHRSSSEKHRSSDKKSSSSKAKQNPDSATSLWKILTTPSSSKKKSTPSKESSTKKEERKKERKGKDKHSSSSRSKDKDNSKDKDDSKDSSKSEKSKVRPKTSLKSPASKDEDSITFGVNMLSDSSGQESLV